MEQLIMDIQKWSIVRNLDMANSDKQLIKLMEELGELSQGYAKEDRDKVIDSLGDMLVVMIIFCQQQGLSLIDCLQEARDTIMDRKGKTVNGVFIKESDLQSGD